MKRVAGGAIPVYLVDGESGDPISSTVPLETSSGGGGSVGDVNITEVGGVAVTTSIPTRPDPGVAVNVPEILTAAGNALAANANRKLWSIQNLGTNPLFVRLAASASTSVFHVILKAGTGADDGTGGFISDELHKGVVSVAGTSPRFVVTEIT